MIYIGWQGFQLNLEIFHNPINALRLKEDYENLHQEQKLGSLSVVSPARCTIVSFYGTVKDLPEDCRGLIDEISEYYAYLETTGYKLAHYFGFRLADEFLPYVIPGYVSNHAYSNIYQRTTRISEYQAGFCITKAKSYRVIFIYSIKLCKDVKQLHYPGHMLVNLPAKHNEW